MHRGFRRAPRHLGALMATLGTAVAIAACGSTASGGGGASAGSSGASAKGAPFRVLYITGLSGPLGLYGGDGLKGIDAAANVLNSQGGILGHKVEIIAKDDQSEPTNAVTELESALHGASTPNIVLDGLTSDEGLAMSPALEAAKIPSFNIAAGLNLSKLAYQYIFLPSYATEARADVKGLVAHHVTSVSVVYPAAEQGADELATFRPAAKAAGIKIVSAVNYSPSALDLTPTWLKAAAAHPNGYMLITEGQTVVALKSRLEAGITSFTMCDTTCGANPLSSQVPHAGLVNVETMSQPVASTPPSQRTPAEKTFITALTKLGLPSEISVPASEYDILMVVAAAAKQANSVSSTAINAALNSLKAPAAYAAGIRYSFSTSDHYAVPQADVSAFGLFSATDVYTKGVFLPASG